MTTNELALELEADRGANRSLDARIAVALYQGGGHPDSRDNTYARIPSKSDECAPGTYWISAFSGLSLRTAPDYTSDPTLKRLALSALRPQPDGDAVERVKQAISRAEIDKPQRSLSYYLGVGIDASGHDFARHDALITIAAQAAIAAMPAREGTVEHLCQYCAARVLLMDPAFLDQVDEALEQAGAPKSKMLSILQKIEALSTMPAKGRDEVLEEAMAKIEAANPPGAGSQFDVGLACGYANAFEIVRAIPTAKERG